ncbi:hypothetical protein [Ferruginibacter sp.]
MNRTTILVAGMNEVMLQLPANRLPQNDEWQLVAASTAEEAIEKFHQADFDVVVLCKDVVADERKLRRIFTHQKDDLIILQNSSDELPAAAIKTALQKKNSSNRRTFSITDDALKNAMLPINIQ